MAVHVLALTVDLRLPQCRSRKDKRAITRAMIDGARRRYQVAAAETDHLDRWQRCEMAFTTVSGTRHQVEEVLDAVERFVWSHPEVDVLSTERYWLETDP